MILLACVLALGGWFVVAPAMTWRTGARAEPPIDIETPDGRARREALLALARMADEPFCRTGDSSWLERSRQERSLMARTDPVENDRTPCVNERRLLKHLIRVAAIGELGLVREAAEAASAASR